MKEFARPPAAPAGLAAILLVRAPLGLLVPQGSRIRALSQSRCAGRSEIPCSRAICAKDKPQKRSARCARQGLDSAERLEGVADALEIFLCRASRG